MVLPMESEFEAEQKRASPGCRTKTVTCVGLRILGRKQGWILWLLWHLQLR